MSIGDQGRDLIIHLALLLPLNWLLASLPITLFAVGFYVWRHALHESSPLVLAALIGLDHLIAFMIARPLLVHFLAANFSSSRLITPS